MSKNEAEVVETNETEELDTREFLEKEFDKLEEDSGQEKEKPAEEQEEIEQEEVSYDDKSGEEEASPDPVDDDWSKYGFRKDVWDHLNGLDDVVKTAIKDRQEAYFSSRNELENDAKYGQGIKSAIEPFEGYLEELGVSAEAALPALLSTERTLRTGNDSEKMLALRKLAHDYGIDVNVMAQQPFDANSYQLQQQIAAQQSRLDQLDQRAAQSAEDQTLVRQIEEFEKTHEHYEKVQNLMADLLDRGIATGSTPDEALEDAYVKALRLDDDLFAQTTAQQQKAAERQKLAEKDKAAKAAKASAGSLKGAPAGRSSTPPESTEEAVARAMEQHGY
jgi:hypothetical protein